MNLPRRVYELWILEAASGRLEGWKLPLLRRALGRDPELRALALDLLDFECSEAPPESAPDLRPRLRPLVAAEPAERALFPSAWIPAGALAALALTALVALGVRPRHPARTSSDAAPVSLFDATAPVVPAVRPPLGAALSRAKATAPRALTATPQPAATPQPR